MKIKLDKDFSKAISEASKFAASSGSDIYKCLKIQGGDNVVTITAYNGSGAFYETKAKADVKESGLIALPASMIKNLTERFRGELIADEKVVEIKDARSKFELAPMKIDGFPTIPAIDETTATIVMDAKLFYEGIENVCYAAGEAEGHPENNSVKMSSEGGKLFFDALDGFRAARYIAILPDQYKDVVFSNMMIPIPIVKQIIGDKQLHEVEEIRITNVKSGKHMIFEGGNVRIISPTVAAIAMNLGDIMQPHKMTAVLQTEEIQELFRKLEIITSQSGYASAQVPLVMEYHAGDDHIEYSINSTVARMHETIACAIEGEAHDVRMGFNPKYFSMPVKSIASETTRLNIGENYKQIYVLPEQKKDSNITHLVLPIRIKASA